MPGSVALFLIVMFSGFFACIFGIYYLFTRQNLAMIEKGMNPKVRYNRPAPFRNLKWALLLIGAGAGLFLAYILDEYVLIRTFTYIGDNGSTHTYTKENPAIYFALIAIGGGLGLFSSYRIERNWWEANKEEAQG
jgi:hypothetical protein